MSVTELDTRRCPLCKAANGCAMARGASSCWCFAAKISHEVLLRIPLEARERVCICLRCASETCRSDDTVRALHDHVRKWR